MKTMITIRKGTLVALLFAGFAACKKDDPTPGSKPIETLNFSISELKAKSTSASVTLGEEGKLYKIRGVVISDNGNTGKNIDPKTVVLVQEDNNAGIIVNFSEAHSFALGTEAEIGVSNQKLEVVNGEIVLNAIPVDSARSIASDKSIAAKEANISEILDKKNSLNGTLVKIAATALTGGDGKFTGTLTMTDATGNITTEILPTADFAEEAYPPSVSELTGIVRIHGEIVRIDVRKADDVVVGDIKEIRTESFENLTASEYALYIGQPLNISGYPSSAFGGLLSSSNGVILKYKGSEQGDAAFTKEGKDYPYIFSYSDAPSFYFNGTGLGTNYGNKLKGVRTVTVTFAGSNSRQLNFDDFNKSWGMGTAKLNTFVEGTDYVQIGISFSVVGTEDPSKFLKISSKYTKLDGWHTFTVTVPTREELIASGATEFLANEFLENPNFAVYNLSSARSGAVSNAAIWLSPILIDKIEFGF